MESQRSFLLIGLALVSFLLWQQWQVDYGPKPVQSTQNVESVTPSTPSSDIPTSVPSATAPNTSGDVPVSDNVAQVSPVVSNSNSLVKVTTDTLDLLIDTRGGDVVSANLVKFPVTQGSNDSYSLLRPDSNSLYIAQSGLIGRDAIDTPKGRPAYVTAQQQYSLQNDQLIVPLKWTSADGLVVTKSFIFTRGHHEVKVEYSLENNTGSDKQFQQYAQLKQSIEGQESSMFMPTYRGGAYSTQEDQYSKFSFDDMEDERLNQTTLGGWSGMLEHYFVSAWVPPQDQTNQLYSATIQGRYAAIGFKGQTVDVPAGSTTTISSTLYMGPKDQDSLAKIAKGLDLTVDYGPLWMISQVLFTLLQWIQSIVINWGLAIIVITIIVKGAMYPLTKKQYESMAKMRNLAPKMAQLKERFGDDRQKMSQAMMEMYKKEKVNPMGGCFPLLLQMPIFLALYWVLLESVELRHADFIFWITDLSVKDPYFVLPILTGLSMYLLQKLQPMTVQDPMQQKIMQWMPVAMSLFFFIFPAGLVLYWLISNIITLIQAKIIYSSMEKRGLKTK
ncbi:membrane protein insertase YidC [Aliiglaciecola sp. LCG003]|uniref:membrane protein insertase YidC n=1 Tax=Aliiglaciecola sp. LCG003 TaxID=3053655 RepID=UPI002572501B|nr:membrane protein insertase YidC [Aliiglaciecola sp. LCG003]WJG09455.1 membrane protein insertase YidC [Aliiglaciecola sp. LCG003]